jgi:hypothetical protein
MTQWHPGDELDAPEYTHIDAMRSAIREAIKFDRDLAVDAMLVALSEADAMRPIEAQVLYQHVIIGSHKFAQAQLAMQIAEFLTTEGVIKFGRNRIDEDRTQLVATLHVIVPPEAKIEPTPIQIEGKPAA